jgi:adenylate cyclase
VFLISYTDSQGKEERIGLRRGHMIIGRAADCDLVVQGASVSRHHARLSVTNGRCTLADAGSRGGTFLNGTALAEEKDLRAGDSFQCGEVTFTVELEMPPSEVLSDAHVLVPDAGSLVRRIDDHEPRAREIPAAAAPSPAAPVITPAAPIWRPGHTPDRRRGSERRQKARPYKPERRSGRDRRQNRFVRLLTEISKTLVTVQPLPQVLARVVDLVFEVVPAERTVLLLRDAVDEALSPRVRRHRDGTVLTDTTISRTVVNKVMRERVAMLAADARSDSRIDPGGSIQGMHVRSFMCVPLWNRDEVSGVLYADSPKSRSFVAEDLDVFTALANYSAVAIERARMQEQLLRETRGRERLQRYHSPGVVRQILGSGGGADAPLEVREMDLSVMFCDIVSFTSRAEDMEPNDIAQELNHFFTVMADELFEFDGTLDKFLGDAILAVFGAPIEQPDHADRAVRAALAMRRGLARINQSTSRPPIQVRIGINSGRALTGDIGALRRREFTVLGDVVNAAARIQKLADPDQIVISTRTRERLRGPFNLTPLGKHQLRGRQSAMELFVVHD